MQQAIGTVSTCRAATTVRSPRFSDSRQGICWYRRRRRQADSVCQVRVDNGRRSARVERRQAHVRVKGHSGPRSTRFVASNKDGAEESIVRPERYLEWVFVAWTLRVMELVSQNGLCVRQRRTRQGSEVDVPPDTKAQKAADKRRQIASRQGIDDAPPQSVVRARTFCNQGRGGRGGGVGELRAGRSKPGKARPR